MRTLVRNSGALLLSYILLDVFVWESTGRIILHNGSNNVPHIHSLILSLLLGIGWTLWGCVFGRLMSGIINSGRITEKTAETLWIITLLSPMAVILSVVCTFLLGGFLDIKLAHSDQIIILGFFAIGVHTWAVVAFPGTDPMPNNGKRRKR